MGGHAVKITHPNILRNTASLVLYICRRSPISVAAAVIYMITQLSDDKKLLKG
jgi:transcription initiation factor TFIIIB Brf1 subunit/transcription initiation factor TFIIB